MEFLTATLGKILGTSITPEVWVAVGLIVAKGRTRVRFVKSLAMATVSIMALRWTVLPPGAHFDLGSQFVLSLTALAFWSLFIRGVINLVNRWREAELSTIRDSKF